MADRPITTTHGAASDTPAAGQPWEEETWVRENIMRSIQSTVLSCAITG